MISPREKHRQVIAEHGELRPSEVARLKTELAALKARSAEIESALNIVPPWQPGIDVKTDEVYSHNGANWRIVQDHTTAAHWEPGSPGLESLYEAV